MKILALETSAKSVSCAVVEDGAPLASAYQCTGLPHSRTLLPMVDAMLKNADLTIDDMDALAIAAGPGSFTVSYTHLIARHLLHTLNIIVVESFTTPHHYCPMSVQPLPALTVTINQRM